MTPHPLLVNPALPALFPATASEIRALSDAISPARLSTYRKRAHENARRALALYAWNVDAAAALYPVLQVNEITLRNAVNRAVVSQFGVAWPYSRGFLRALPTYERTTFENARAKLERTLGVARASAGDVVASQSYWFWVFLLTARFERRIWSREFGTAFPRAPPGITREIVRSRTDAIRHIRNRIAHHEPILGPNPVGVHQRASSIVRWISPAQARWIDVRWPAARRVLILP
ncbi:MAG TPA: hypothetical protein VE913_03055 [Longimicrobium sp.]|nr:hypothetical protein [Longimicrobium sp.]